jgi:hypothetical protein
MPKVTLTREHLARVFSVGVGVLTAYAFAHSLTEATAPGVKVKPPAVRVAIRASARTAPPPVAVETKELPLPAKNGLKKRVKHAVTHSSEKAQPLPDAPATPQNEILTLSQPELRSTPLDPVPQTEALPLIGAELPKLPEAPPDDSPRYVPAESYPERRGGTILVLGVLVNDQGFVKDVRILVPTRFYLGDITVALSYQNKQWRNLNPPLQPGEFRQLELRFDQEAAALGNNSTLP